ncbi:hypothetical protein CERZMDRAFT_105968 [Cercospora zeae-maydis SCOH1-5]|uniref:CFEM domain-containing protein n=1 Tax=Cercospora zeae-maydis SCOH1-5 TaxID=717836 RepID=A0A6A6FGH2_9PEZI|nr:hypothetical protein CERZMDRAFT_105968 [Cercospora zeae-maydis SCOH1-5]
MFKLAGVALLASVALAQIPGLPSCAQGCITNYGGCNQVDVKCICTNQPLLETLSCCVSKNCDQTGIDAVIKFADSLCGSYGVTTLPKAATCAATGSTPAPTGTASSSASGSESTPATTSAPASRGSETSTETSTPAAGAQTTGSSTSAAAAPTNMAQQVLALGLGAAGLLAAL